MDLITKRTKLKEIVQDNEKKVGELAQRFHIKADDMEYVNKGFSEINMDIAEGERAVIKYVSTISVDRDGEIVLPNGVMLEDFQKNPVVLYGHNYGGAMFGGQGQLPIARDMWIKSDGKGLIAKQKYHEHQFADDIYKIHKDGGGLASSIGFIPLKWVDKSDKKEWDSVIGQVKKDYGVQDDHFKGASRIYTKTYLLEHSDVPVPSNPDALTLAVKSGAFEFQSKDLETDIYPEQEEKSEVETLLDTVDVLAAHMDEYRLENEKLTARIFQLEKYVQDQKIEPIIPEQKSFDPDKIEEMISKRFDKILNKIDVKRGKV